MQNGGVVLINTSMVSVGSNVSTAVKWNGGQGVLVMTASQYAPIINLMLNDVGPQLRAIKVNSSALQADVVMPLMLPAGNYSIHSATGSSVGMFAALLPTP